MNKINKVGLALAVNMIAVSVWGLAKDNPPNIIIGYVVLVAINVMILWSDKEKTNEK